MSERIYNVLFLCTGNSARSILAESILRKDGRQHFRSFSAGSQPKGRVNPLAIKVLNSLDYPTDNLRSKSWTEFATPGAPPLDIVITVCDAAASETCPVWPGHPLTAHWGMPDPAGLSGRAARSAFAETYRLLETRIGALVELPFDELEGEDLRRSLREIGSYGLAPIAL